MRIIGGSARGRKLIAPEGDDTRPTTDKIRESLFNILGQRTDDETVLDLFGGTGAMALEAMSRGAASAVICDIGRKQTDIIKKNALAVCRDDCCNVAVLNCDYRNAIKTSEGGFSLVFIDPPYRMHDAYTEALELLKSGRKLTDGARLVLEHSADFEPAIPDGYTVYDRRRYRDTVVTLIKFGVLKEDE